MSGLHPSVPGDVLHPLHEPAARADELQPRDAALPSRVEGTPAASDQIITIVPQAHEANQEAERILADFWSGKRERAEADPEHRTSRLKNIGIQEPWVKTFLDRNSEPATRASDFARICAAINWYATTTHGVQSNFSGLSLFGVDTTKMESIWGTLKEFAKHYSEAAGVPHIDNPQAEHDRRQGLVEAVWERHSRDFANPLDRAVLPAIVTKFFRAADGGAADLISLDAGLARALLDASEQKLAERLKVQPSGIPLSYEFFNLARDRGVLMPDSRTIAKLNEALLAPGGANVFLFCCPDYARERLPNGTYHYTMDGLGTGTGLTASRALPVVARMLQRLRALSEDGKPVAPATIRIGYADFEATLENAESCGMGKNPHEFLRRLGLSVKAVEQELRQSFPSARIEFVQVKDEVSEENPVGLVEMQVLHADSRTHLATISIGRVTDTFREFNPDYKGIDSFHALVEQERVSLMRLAQADLNTLDGKERSTAEWFRRAVDKLLVLRLDLMLEWRTADAPHYIETLSQHAPFDDKAAIVRDLQHGMASGDERRTEALRHLRGKIASQGAEYAVMHRLMGAAPNLVHMYADAANMWQLFGDRKIPILGIRGGYTGSDVVDLSGPQS